MADRPDWCGQVLIKGMYGTTLTPIAVDVLGNLLALIQGNHLGTPTTIQTDGNGVMLANLYAQDLNYLKVRPIYGQHRIGDGPDVHVDDTTWTDVLTLTGKGSILQGYFYFYEAFDPALQWFRFSIDGTSFNLLNVAGAYTKTSFGLSATPFYSVAYDPVNNIFLTGIRGPINFETSLVVQAYQSSGSLKHAYAYLYYALVP